MITDAATPHPAGGAPLLPPQVLLWGAVGIVLVVTVFDAYLLQRMLAVWRRTRRAPHLVIAGGILASYTTGVAGAVLLAVQSAPERLGGWWDPLRALVALGSGLAYGLVPVFAASAFRPRSRAALALALGAAGAALALCVTALLTEPRSVDTPAMWAYPVRVPFMLVIAGGAAWAGWEARALAAHHLAAVRAGAPLQGVTLARMRTFAAGAFALAVSPVFIAAHPPHAPWHDLRGYATAGAMTGAGLVFVVCCWATWATPAWLRRRWEGAPAASA